MNIENRPADYVFAGNIADIKITGLTGSILFQLTGGVKTIVSEEYHPDPKGTVTIRLRDLLETSVNCPAMNVAAETVAMYSWSIGGSHSVSGTFRCLKGGHRAAVDAATFVKHNFLTWQPQTRKTMYHTPQWLRYVAVVDGCKLRGKGYFADGTDQTVDLGAEMSAGLIYTHETTYGTIRGRFKKQVTYYDVWVERAGVKLTWVQRYVLANQDEGTPDYFVFENSLGGHDSVCFYGAKTDIAESESINSIFGDQTLEYGIDWKRTFKKNTGYFPDTNTRRWVLEFFSSTNRYHLRDGALNRIVISKPKLEAVDGELGGYEFVYAYSEQNRYENMARVEVPPMLEIIDPAGDLFFLEAKLNQFKRADPTRGDLLFPVQYAHSSEWMTLTLIDLLRLTGDGEDGLLDFILETLSKKYDKAGGPIRGNVQIEEDDDEDGGHLEVQHTATATQFIAREKFGSPAFLPGWSGLGCQFWMTPDGKWHGEVDDLRVRGDLHATEFVVDTVRAVGGELLVTNRNRSKGMIVLDPRLFVDIEIDGVTTRVLNPAENAVIPLRGVLGEF